MTAGTCSSKTRHRHAAGEPELCTQRACTGLSGAAPHSLKHGFPDLYCQLLAGGGRCEFLLHLQQNNCHICCTDPAGPNREIVQVVWCSSAMCTSEVMSHPTLVAMPPAQMLSPAARPASRQSCPWTICVLGSPDWACRPEGKTQQQHYSLWTWQGAICYCVGLVPLLHGHATYPDAHAYSHRRVP